MVEPYLGQPVTVIGIERGSPYSSLAEVEDWIATYGWTFPVGVNDSENQIFNQYEPSLGSTAYDTYYVVDPQGKISFRDLRPNYSTDLPKLREAVDAALGTVPVEPATWGRIKRQY